MKSLKDYLDFREFLRDQYKEKSQDKEVWSVRAIKNQLGLTSTKDFGRILDGTKTVPESMIPALIRLCGISEHSLEAEELRLLILYTQSQDSEARKFFGRQLEIHRSSRPPHVSTSEEMVFEKWYSLAIVNALKIVRIPNDPDGPATLAKLLFPNITVEAARDALDDLLEMDFIKVENGFFKVVKEQFELDGDVGASTMQQICANMAEAHRRIPKNARDCNLLWVNLDGKAYADLVKLSEGFLKECGSIRDTHRTRIQASPDTRVYQILCYIHPSSEVYAGQTGCPKDLPLRTESSEVPA